METSTRKIVFMLVGCGAAATLGIAALFGVIGSRPTSSGLSPEAVAVRPMNTPTTIASGTQLATPTPVPVPLVSLALISFDRQPSLGGVTATIVIANHRSSTLAFSFDPAYDLKLVDARGNLWTMRWAEYDGSSRLAAGSSRQLARAFFAGPAGNPIAWPLTLSVERAPTVGTVEWHISQRGAPTPAIQTSALQPVPTVARTRPIAFSLANPSPSSGLGGIQVDLMVTNDQATDLVFHFDPNAQITAADNLHRPYHVQWAQYGGIVHVGPHSTVRLARVFFEGPIADARASWLAVQLDQVPSAGALRNVVSLQ